MHRFRAWFAARPLWQKIGLIFLALAFVTAPFRDATPPPAPAPTPSPTPKPSATAQALLPEKSRALCRQGLAELERIGLIRAATPDRIDVEDSLWAATPARDKETIFIGVSCALRGRPLQRGEQIEAFGFRSGKRVARDKAGWGVTFD